jgi:putative ABC transport system permease protein
VVAQVRRELRAIDPELTLHDVRTMRQVMASDIARETFALVLMGVFGTIAILLVTVGIYGVLTYSVNERTREIGIRLALGADAGTVRSAVVLKGLTLAIAGIVLGLLGALALTRLLQSLLFNVGTLDPAVLAGIPIAMTIVAALAGYLPARRATRVDPMEALRQE